MKHLWIVLPLLVVGCSKKEEAPAATPAAAPATQPAATPAAGPPAATPTLPAVSGLASSDHEKGTAKADVTELKRTSGGTLMLRVTITNTGSKDFDWSYSYGDGAQGARDYNAVGGIHLMDEANKKKYFVVRDAESNCVCSRGMDGVKPGERANIWARFPQPPDDVQKISVVIPHFAPMDDVPIAK